VEESWAEGTERGDANNPSSWTSGSGHYADPVGETNEAVGYNPPWRIQRPRYLPQAGDAVADDAVNFYPTSSDC